MAAPLSAPRHGIQLYSGLMIFYVLEYSKGILLYLSIALKIIVYLNKYAFIKSFSFPQYLDVSSLTQLTFKR